MGKILVLGSKGMLGGELLKVFGDGAVGWDRGDVDVTNAEELKLKIKDLGPSTIINCVAYNDVDAAEVNRELAFRLNAEVVKNLAAVAKELDVPLVHFSSNYVFDGIKGEYLESDEPCPISVYGQSKLHGERHLISGCSKYYLVRTSVLFGPKGESGSSKKSFVDLMLGLSEKQPVIKVVNDEINSLTYAVDLAAQVKLLLDEGKPFGIYHITNSGQASWYDYAKEIFLLAKRPIELLPISGSEFQRPAKRPAKAVLLNTKLPSWRSWQEALAEYLGGNFNPKS